MQSPADISLERIVPEKASKGDVRTPTEIDRDRLLYSSHFARLAEVTQVISADHGYVFHNRLTHSLKVAQLARRIAERMQRTQPQLADDFGVDCDAAEAAALAHDLGHPPFGHIAEEELDKRIKVILKDDGYEGNAQSFRLVTYGTIGDAEDERGVAIDYGLNLTRRTLNGILKYPWKFGENPKKPHKWGSYLTEADTFNWAREGREKEVRSVEAEVMDWSDDITYAVHDLFDFYCAGKIPLERLINDKKGERDVFLKDFFKRDKIEREKQARLKRAFDRFLERLRKSMIQSFTGTRIEHRSVWGRMTVLITAYVNAIELVAGSSSRVTVDDDLRDEVNMAKQLTWHYVILNNELATSQHGQRKVVGDLFDILYDAADALDEKKGNLKLFPRFFEKDLSEITTTQKRIRLVADYISSMTEKEAVNLYKRIHGFEQGRMV